MIVRAPNWPMVITILSWGFNFIAIKLIYEHTTPAAVCLVRYLIMYVVLVGLCAALRIKLRYKKQDAFRLMILGALSMGVYMFFFMEGMKRSGPAEGAIILGTSPIFTAILAAIFGQSRLTVSGLLGACIAFAGVSLVVTAGHHGGDNTIAGNLLVLISSFIWAMCAVMTRPLVAKQSPLSVLTLSMPGALIVLVPYGLSDMIHTQWSAFTGVTWASLLFNSIMAGAVGFYGFYAGVQKIGAAGAMMYQFFVPPITAFFAWLILHDTLAPLQFVGLFVVIAGVYWSSRSANSSANSNPQLCRQEQ